VITNDGKEYDAKVIGVHPTTDLAILKIDSSQEFPAVYFVNDIEEDIQIGQFAIAIGNALAEFQNTVSL